MINDLWSKKKIYDKKCRGRVLVFFVVVPYAPYTVVWPAILRETGNAMHSVIWSVPQRSCNALFVTAAAAATAHGAHSCTTQHSGLHLTCPLNMGEGYTFWAVATREYLTMGFACCRMFAMAITWDVKRLWKRHTFFLDISYLVKYSANRRGAVS